MVRTFVAGDPGPRPLLEAPCRYLAPRPQAKIYAKADVVQRNEPVAEKLVLPCQMSQIGPAVTRARFAGALGIERPQVRAVLRVLEVDAAIPGQGRAVTGQTRRQHAVEHIYPERYDLQDADGITDPHKVPWLLGGQPGRSERQRLQHLLPGLTYRESPHSVAVEPDLDRQPEALLSQVGVKPALHDPEEGLISPPVRLLRPQRPSPGAPQRLLVVFAARIGRRTLVEDHCHVRSRPQVEMIRVPKHDAGPRLPQVARRESLDGALRPYRHEGWRLHQPARRNQDARPRLAVTGMYLYGDGGAHRRRPPSRRSIASPKE